MTRPDGFTTRDYALLAVLLVAAIAAVAIWLGAQLAGVVE